jgi:hypothetical protein
VRVCCRIEELVPVEEEVPYRISVFQRGKQRLQFSLCTELAGAVARTSADIPLCGFGLEALPVDARWPVGDGSEGGDELLEDPCAGVEQCRGGVVFFLPGLVAANFEPIREDEWDLGKRVSVLEETFRSPLRSELRA